MTSNFHKHHRKRRAHGGGGEWGNMIELPSEIHELVHANPELAYQRGLLVKSHDDPNQIRPNVRDFCADLGVDWPPTKPKRARLKGDDVAKRKTVTIKLPEGVNGQDWEELLTEAEAVEQAQPDTQYEQWRGGIAKGKLLVAVLERFTGRAGG